MKILLHRSHCSATKLDGWSGAPGEAAYTRGLCDLVATACRTLGMTVTIVDGDLLDHPEFHTDYSSFVALHYDANEYGGIGGTFWGRASASPTGDRDDRLGAALWAKLRTIPSAPPEHFERLNANVTDYYGFRLTSDKTPGVLIELGVGAPGAPDYLWLRSYQQDIADAIALGLATQEEDMAFATDPDATAYRADVKATLEAIKAVLATLAHHKHVVGEPSST